MKALYTLGYKWFAEDEDGDLYAYIEKPEKSDCQWLSGEKRFRVFAYPAVASLVSWSDTKPYDIGKALEIKR